MIKINHALFGLLALGSLAIGGCSSSTSTNPPASATLVVPATVNFGGIATGPYHDTAFQVTNNTTDTIRITSFGFSSSAMRDTVDVLPYAIAAGKAALIHVEVVAADSGAISGFDTVHFNSGTTASSSTVSVLANGYYAPPAAGSTFRFAIVVKDSTGATTSSGDTTYTIVATNLSIGGKTNVTAVRGQAGDTTYLHFESNGDITRYLQVKTQYFTTNASWVVLPVASHAAVRAVLLDTNTTITVNYNGTPLTLPAHIIATDSSYFVDAEKLAVGAESFDVSKVTTTVYVTVTVSAFGSMQTIPVVASGDLWYSPKLKYYVKRVDTQTVSGGSPAISTYNMLSYSKK